MGHNGPREWMGRRQVEEGAPDWMPEKRQMRGQDPAIRPRKGREGKEKDGQFGGQENRATQ